LYRLLATRVHELPGVGFRLTTSDALVGPFGVVIAIVGVVAIAALSCVFTALLVRRSALSTVRVSAMASRAPTRARILPLLVAFALMFVGVVIGGGGGANWFAAGLLLATLAIPLVMGTVVSAVGTLLRCFRVVAAEVAGRRIQADPRALGRAVASVMLLVFVVVQGRVWIDRFKPQSSGPRSEASAVTVRTPGIDSVITMRLAAPEATQLVLPLRKTPDGSNIADAQCHSDTSKDTVIICDRLMTSSAPTLSGAMPGLSEDIEAQAIRIQPDAPADWPIIGAVMVGPSSQTFVDQVRQRAFANLSAPLVTARDTALTESPYAQWLRSGLVLAGLLSGLGAVMGFIDDIFRQRRRSGFLQRIGASRRQIAAVLSWELAGSFLVAFLCSFSVASITGVLYLVLAGVGSLPLSFVLWVLTSGLIGTVAISAGCAILASRGDGGQRITRD
jgi:hypothetical protein